MRLKDMPSQKTKIRYLAFRVMSDDNIYYDNLKDALWESATDWMGEKGIADSGFRIIKNLWDGRSQAGVISCASRYVDQVKMSMAFIHQIGDSKVIINVFRVSGTIKSLKGSK